jgi:hypothetical protein
MIVFRCSYCCCDGGGSICGGGDDDIYLVND